MAYFHLPGNIKENLEESQSWQPSFRLRLDSRIAGIRKYGLLTCANFDFILRFAF